MFHIDCNEYRARNNLDECPRFHPMSLLPRLKDIAEDLRTIHPPCFARAVFSSRSGLISFYTYLNLLIKGHLYVNAKLHKFDTIEATNLEHLLEVDLLAGTIKRYMLDKSFPRLRNQECVRLRELCEAVHACDNLKHLNQRLDKLQEDFNSLSPEWMDILLMITYAKRSLKVFIYIVSSFRGPDCKSTLNIIPSRSILYRQISAGQCEYSLPALKNKLIEIQMWNAMLEEKENNWLQLPLTENLATGLNWLIREFGGNPKLRSSPHVQKLFQLLNSIGFITTARDMSGFLSIEDCYSLQLGENIVPCTMEEACMIVSYFPLSETLQNPGDSAELIIPITQWDMENDDRLGVLQLLLEHGCDPNDKIDISDGKGVGRPKLHLSPLQLALERGDTAMADLLQQFGAVEPILPMDIDTDPNTNTMDDVKAQDTHQWTDSDEYFDREEWIPFDIDAELAFLDKRRQKFRDEEAQQDLEDAISYARDLTQLGPEEARNRKIGRIVLRTTGVGSEPPGMDFFG